MGQPRYGEVGSSLSTFSVRTASQFEDSVRMIPLHGDLGHHVEASSDRSPKCIHIPTIAPFNSMVTFIMRADIDNSLDLTGQALTAILTLHAQYCDRLYPRKECNDRDSRTKRFSSPIASTFTALSLSFNHSIHSTDYRILQDRVVVVLK